MRRIVATLALITACRSAPSLAPAGTPERTPERTIEPPQPQPPKSEPTVPARSHGDHPVEPPPEESHAHEHTAASAPSRTIALSPKEASLSGPTFPDVKPFFAQHCDRCHGATPDDEKIGAKAHEHLDTSSYPFRGHHGDDVLAVIAKQLTRDAKGRTKMPADDRRGLKDEEIALVKDWVAAERRRQRSH